jgi:hypothetical protein
MVATTNLLRSDPRTLIKIYSDTGIPYYWLKKFSAGEFNNPSVNRVQDLYEHLSGKKLAIEE